MKRLRVQESWLKFRNSVVPKDASKIQLNEMRRAFYAGANMIFMTLVSQVSEGDEVQEEDMTMMDDFMSEFKKFAEDVKMGEK